MVARFALFLALSASALALGCGASVSKIDVHDGRLPLDARRWVGEAEDGVTVARAWRQDAALALRETRAWRASLPSSGEVAPGEGELPRALGLMAGGRVALAERGLMRAEAAEALARAKLELTYAETATRYDLERYELAPLRAAVAEARANLEGRARAVEDARAELDRITGELWERYAAYIKAGGDRRILWLPGARSAQEGGAD